MLWQEVVSENPLLCVVLSDLLLSLLCVTVRVEKSKFLQLALQNFKT